MKEVWKDIPGYEGHYQASSFGRVRSLDRLIDDGRPNCQRMVKGRVLSPQKRWNGYEKVCLSRGGSTINHGVHRLVCMAFHGMPDEKLDACHNDGTRNNNRPENLRWASRKENLADKKRHGTHTRGESHPVATLNESQAIDIKRRAESGEPYGPIAREHGITVQTVCDIRKGRSWKHLSGAIK